MAKRQKKETLVSPIGVAIYPYLHKADTGFDVDGVFRTKMRFKAHEVSELEEKFEAMAKEERKKAMADAKEAKKGDKLGKLKKATIVTPFSMSYDDEGEETDEVVANFKQKRIIRFKDGTSKETKVAVWDAKRNPTKANPWSGSKLRIVYSPHAYYFPPNNEFGVSLKLIGAQIIELVEGGGPRSAEEYGLTEVDGFVDDRDGDEDSPDDDMEDDDNRNVDAAAEAEGDF